MSTEKQLSYQITNTYSVLNERTSKTKNIWVVFHGIGYLSRYFIRLFKGLNPEENYIIAPQAQAKYYLNNKYTHVGASWLTKERTEEEMDNVLNYLDALFKAEDLNNVKNLNILGFSQGVSIATRWVARRKIDCSRLMLHSGKIPQELSAEDFKFLKNTEISFIYGTEDEYLKKGIVQIEEERMHRLFPENFEIITFKGGHDLNMDIIAGNY